MTKTVLAAGHIALGLAPEKVKRAPRWGKRTKQIFDYLGCHPKSSEKEIAESLNMPPSSVGGTFDILLQKQLVTYELLPLREGSKRLIRRYEVAVCSLSQ